jgi:hypothetical protein
LTYRLHDLLHYLARHFLQAPVTPLQKDDLPGLGLDVSFAHRILLERYATLTQNGLWHTLPEDGYIHTYLTWHMEQAGWIDILHSLLREETPERKNGWFEARDRLGQTSGYLEDVSRAWRLAEARSVGEESSVSYGTQCRYGLILTSLNSLAASIPPILLIALVRTGVWNPLQGLAYGNQIPDQGQKDFVLAQLVLLLAESAHTEQARSAAEEIQDHDLRTKTLTRLVPYLSGLPQREVLAACRREPLAGSLQ